MNKKNILIFPGGTEIALEIQRALMYEKDITLYSAGSNIPNHAPFVFKNHFIVPDVTKDDSFYVALNKIISENNIHYIFPAHDDVLISLIKNKDKLNAKIISSPPETCLMARSKIFTYEKFKNILPVPKIYKHYSDIDKFPVFIKPDKGQGSINAYLIKNKYQLQLILDTLKENMIMMEYLPGKEYTIDCFTDRKRGLLFCSGRLRLKIKNGITVCGEPVDEITNCNFKKYAEIISKNLNFYGAWFFQIKEDENGIFKLLEITPRIGGTMSLSRTMGVNLPLLSIYEQENVEIEIIPNKNLIKIDKALINRYESNIKYNAVYIDIDDTLIIKDNINQDIMKFLYQCINTKKEIVILTKHEGDVKKFLELNKIFPSMFDSIIQLKKDEKKSEFIKRNDAIFIDDSFKERKEVNEKCKIPTFDCSMLEALIDERK